ncbi:uncharacterized protein LOC127871935 [Dreissena polymorpha]|uniref:C2H2-type domain-containing protein n=1 Tax=Dreissena polymorpha TaxID=45954 RepID=A0A9D4R945_DREPO|nr:uncharacterized protein LOC127871935 [Dreissena polymorpha]XP_052271168.1 uncharacterized protein LOC127871935 [Dreissena polymorpha]KAH3859664.1 hypothetical protein DPMN_102483 [Dreissena polymorpha]
MAHGTMAKEMQTTTVQSYQMKTIKGPSYLRCEECDKVFTRSWLLKNHHRVHTGERPYKCAYCDKAFADKSNLRQHAKIHTTKEKLFTCSICQKSFAQRRYLMKHASEIHRDISMSLYGEEKSAKISKITPQTKYIIQKPPSKPVTMVVNAQVPRAITDTQSGQLLQTKTSEKNEKEPEPAAAAKGCEQKYSEQDLKDFIKSNQKTMEKNGYIFIKQNFETLDTDTEPTLTEMSDIPVTDISDTVKQEIETKDLLGMGNQLLKVNGKMVFLQMDNRTITREELMKGDTTTVTKDTAFVLNGKVSLNQKSRLVTPKTAKKLVAKTNIVKRHTNILKSAQASAKKQSAGMTFGGDLKQPIASVQSMVQNVMKTGNPVQYLTMTHDNQPITLLQVPNQLSVIPLSIVQLVPSGMEGIQTLSHGQSAILPSNFHNIKIASVPNLGPDSAVTRANNIANAVSRTRAIEMANAMDEKGAAGDMGGVAISSISTPIMSDAPWQGVLNINSEQELLEYINSQSNSGLDTDQGFTILIQNVDPQNNAVLSSLDSHSLLSGSGHMSGIFSDQGGIISDIMPGVSNMDESHLHTASTEETVISNPVLGSVNQMSHSGDEINVESVVIKSQSQDQSHMLSSEEGMKDASCVDDDDDDGGGRQDFNTESCDDVYKDHGHMMLDQSGGEQFSDSEEGQQANEIVFEIKPVDEQGNQEYIVHVNSDSDEVEEPKTEEICESLIDENQVSDAEYVGENDGKDLPTVEAE